MQKIQKQKIDENKYRGKEILKFLVVKTIDDQIHLQILEGETAAICRKKRFVSRECALDCSNGDWKNLNDAFWSGIQSKSRSAGEQSNYSMAINK